MSSVSFNGKRMIHPIPSGTRDVLPEETREVRAITDTLRGVFEGNRYGEVYTPALEYESVLARADLAEVQPTYRVFDESGAVLVLRSDMTVPIARVVATRYGSSEPPLRFCYFAHCYRGVRPQRGQPREVLQAGIELIGSPAPQGTAEALTVLCRALDATGLKDYRIGVGDASLFPALMASLEVPEPARPGLLEALARTRFRRPRTQAPRGRPRAGGCRAFARGTAAPRRPRAADRRAGAGGRGGHGHAPGARAARPGGRRSASSSTWASCGTSATTRERSSRSTTPRSAAPSAAAGATTICSGASGAGCPRSASRWDVDRLHVALAGEERGTGALLVNEASR